jgi:hypothetical protein
MKNSIDKSLLKFAKAQQPIADPFETTSKKQLALAIILSPFICLTAWLWLIVICAIEGK